MPGVELCAVPMDKKTPKLLACGVSDAEGRFTIGEAKSGNYELHGSKRSDGYMSTVLQFYRHPDRTPPMVSLTPEAPEALALVRIGPKNGSIVGRAIDAETGLPIEDKEFVMCRTDEQNACFTTHAINSAGKFNVFVSHSPFTLRIRAQGYQDWFGTGGLGEKEAISVAAGASLELLVSMRRLAEAQDLPLSEAEKRAGINLPAPAQVGPRNGQEFVHYPRTTKLEWAPVEGEYHIGSK
jgi:hypothetical protein